MHFHVKHILRLGHCASVQGKRTLGRKLWSLSTAAAAATQQQPQRGLTVAGKHHATTRAKTYFTRRCCRNYASDQSTYNRAFASARDQPEQYWAEVGQDISWFEPWSKTLVAEDPVFPNW